MRSSREVKVRLRHGNTCPATSCPALRELEALGLELAIVSNANGTVQALAERLGLTECVGCVLDSFVEQVEKFVQRVKAGDLGEIR